MVTSRDPADLNAIINRPNPVAGEIVPITEPKLTDPVDNAWAGASVEDVEAFMNRAREEHEDFSMHFSGLSREPRACGTASLLRQGGQGRD